MPDVRVRIFKEEFPDEETINRMRVGDRFIWVPAQYLRRHYGIGPAMYIMKKEGLRSDSISCALPMLTHHG